MTHSESINELANALVKAQSQVRGASKDSDNPYFKSKYADLSSVWDACRSALTGNGLSVVQSPRINLALSAETTHVEVETLLLHQSGQWVRDTLAIPVTKADAQGVGSAITYARRYALAAFVGVAPEDDDGNAAVAGNGQAKETKIEKPKGFDEWALDMASAASNGLDTLNAAWKDSPQVMREYTMKHETKWREKLRAIASQAVPA